MADDTGTPTPPFFIRRQTLLLIAAGWAIWALLSAVEQAARNGWLQRPYGFAEAVLTRLPLAAALAAATPAILMLSRRAPVFGRPNVARIGLHLGACVALVVLIDALSCGLTTMTQGVPFDLGTPRRWLLRVLGLWFLPVALLYWLIVVTDHGVRHFVTARRQGELAARLTTLVAEARLDALKLQLHPHFLFNALHTITTLIRTGRNPDAIRVTAGLGSLLRRLLDDAPLQEVTLAEELAFVNDYLAIETIRFSDRLTVHYDIAAGVDSCLVPHLLLQPLVENAVLHGVQSRDDGGVLRISARPDGDRLVLTVADDGIEVPALVATKERRQIGLANTRARLSELYGAHQSLEIRQNDGAGTRVIVTLPLHRTPGLVSKGAVA
jgi:two-component system, LytTR family, sensor kinase